MLVQHCGREEVVHLLLHVLAGERAVGPERRAHEEADAAHPRHDDRLRSANKGERERGGWKNPAENNDRQCNVVDRQARTRYLQAAQNQTCGRQHPKEAKQLPKEKQRRPCSAATRIAPRTDGDAHAAEAHATQGLFDLPVEAHPVDDIEDREEGEREDDADLGGEAREGGACEWPGRRASEPSVEPKEMANRGLGGTPTPNPANPASLTRPPGYQRGYCRPLCDRSRAR